MPGYVIHLAVAEKYLEKHKSKNENYNEFIEGVIYPDSTKIKSETHYGEKSSASNVYEFLKEYVKEINCEEWFEKQVSLTIYYYLINSYCSRKDLKKLIKWCIKNTGKSKFKIILKILKTLLKKKIRKKR